MEWISVNDRLPDQENCWVLVYADGAINCMAYHNGEWKDLVVAIAHNIEITEITHWMPLPKPPK